MLAYGEALFDRIDGHAVLGGAPANMSVHLAAMLGDRARVLVVSARGADELGDRLMRELDTRGVATDLIQTNALPTSEVRVVVGAGGEPTFHIAAPVAWDRIAWTEALSEAAARADIVCYGTLAQRDPVSRSTLQHLLEHTQHAERVCDLNLRAPHDDTAIIRASIAAATTLKINAQELDVIATLYGIADGDDADRVRALFELTGLGTIILTRGARGTAIMTEAGCVEGEPAADNHDVRDGSCDAVGAGDACLAACLAGRALGLSPQQTATLANRAGAFVASRRGATPELPEDLRGFTRA